MASVCIGSLGMLVLLLVKKCFRNGADEVASMVKASRQKTDVSFCLFSISFYLGCPWEVPLTFRGGLSSSESVIKETSDGRQCQGPCLLIDSRPRQVDNQV